MTESVGEKGPDSQKNRQITFVDADHPAIRAKAAELCRGVEDPKAKAVRIFEFVRDKILYDIRMDPVDPEFFKASSTLARGWGFCVPKAILLAALCRAAGIPARVHYVDIINHRVPEWLFEFMKTKLFTWHAYTELNLGGKWVKATPAIDSGVADRHKWILVEFDGENDALFHPVDRLGRKHIEYVADWGVYDDFPHQQMLERFAEVYGHLAKRSTRDRIELAGKL